MNKTLTYFEKFIGAAWRSELHV